LDGQPPAGVAAGQEGLPVTINGLIIDDLIVNRFLTNCRDHFAVGGGRPAHRARSAFFSDLRQDYVFDDFIPHLRDLHQQLDAWEIEAQAEEIT
jgi:hypothetical protein